MKSDPFNLCCFKYLPRNLKCNTTDDPATCGNQMWNKSNIMFRRVTFTISYAVLNKKTQKGTKSL